MIGSRAHCRSGERRLDWNVKGLRGETGPAGRKASPGLCSTFDDLAGLACTAGATRARSRSTTTPVGLGDPLRRADASYCADPHQ